MDCKDLTLIRLGIVFQQKLVNYIYRNEGRGHKD